jgi:hypothetical protein
MPNSPFFGCDVVTVNVAGEVLEFNKYTCNCLLFCFSGRPRRAGLDCIRDWPIRGRRNLLTNSSCMRVHHHDAAGMMALTRT